jgi:alanyl-tRNA synthetase
MASRVEFSDIVGLRQMADQARTRVKGKCVGVFGSEIEGKAVFVVFVTDDLIGRLKAGDIAREVAKVTGGGGGGKPTLAEAGGKNVGKIDEAIGRVPQIVKDLLESAR